MKHRSQRGIIFALVPVRVLAVTIFGSVAMVLREQRKTVQVVCVGDATDLGGRKVFLIDNSLFSLERLQREARRP